MKGSEPECCTPMSPRAAARRKRVADAARTLFAAQGFQNTRMTEISEAAGVKVGQIYRDFDGKEAIVADIVREDLAEFLDEEALGEAVRSSDSQPARQWLANFIKRDCDPAQERLLAQIVVEAARNQRIADLFQCGDDHIRACLMRALAAAVPNASEEARRRLMEIIMVLLLGLPQRRIAAPHTDLGAVAASIGALIERELGWLAAAEPAG